MIAPFLQHHCLTSTAVSQKREGLLSSHSCSRDAHETQIKGQINLLHENQTISPSYAWTTSNKTVIYDEYTLHSSWSTVRNETTGGSMKWPNEKGNSTKLIYLHIQKGFWNLHSHQTYLHKHPQASAIAPVLPHCLHWWIGDADGFCWLITFRLLGHAHGYRDLGDCQQQECPLYGLKVRLCHSFSEMKTRVCFH